MFMRAIALDPAFAQPHAGIADADAIQLQWLLIPKEQQPALRAKALAESDEAPGCRPEQATRDRAATDHDHCTTRFDGRRDKRVLIKVLGE
jgi:hypothetical protein